MKIFKELLSSVALAAVSLMTINIAIPDENLSETKKLINSSAALEKLGNASKNSKPL